MLRKKIIRSGVFGTWGRWTGSLDLSSKPISIQNDTSTTSYETAIKSLYIWPLIWLLLVVLCAGKISLPVELFPSRICDFVLFCCWFFFATQKTEMAPEKYLDQTFSTIFKSKCYHVLLNMLNEVFECLILYRSYNPYINNFMVFFFLVLEREKSLNIFSCFVYFFLFNLIHQHGSFIQAFFVVFYDFVSFIFVSFHLIQ